MSSTAVGTMLCRDTKWLVVTSPECGKHDRSKGHGEESGPRTVSAGEDQCVPLVTWREWEPDEGRSLMGEG